MTRSGSILRALARRGASVAATAGLAAALVVLLFALVPGDAIDALPNGPEVRAQLEAEWGLGGGVGAQLVTALGRLARGDLGHSLTWRPGAPVAEVLAPAFATSAALLVPAVALGLVGGFLLARLRGAGASRAGRVVGRTIAAVSSVPVVLLGLAVVNGVNAATWAAMERGLVARPAWFALPEEPGLVRSGLAVLVLAFGSARLAQLGERARAELDALDAAPWLDALRAQGAPVGWRRAHHLVVPVARLAAEQVAPGLAALIVVERAFSLPGAGLAFWEACAARDWPVAVGVALAAALTTSAARLAADGVAVAVDPREREAEA